MVTSMKITSYLTNFGSLKPDDVFQHDGKIYVRIWEIPVGCCGKYKKIKYNAVLRKDPSQGFTFQDDELVEKL